MLSLGLFSVPLRTPEHCTQCPVNSGVSLLPSSNSPFPLLSDYRLPVLLTLVWISPTRDCSPASGSTCGASDPPWRLLVPLSSGVPCKLQLPVSLDWAPYLRPPPDPQESSGCCLDLFCLCHSLEALQAASSSPCLLPISQEFLPSLFDVQFPENHCSCFLPVFCWFFLFFPSISSHREYPAPVPCLAKIVVVKLIRYF